MDDVTGTFVAKIPHLYGDTLILSIELVSCYRISTFDPTRNIAAQVLEDLYEHLDLGDSIQSSSDFSNEALQIRAPSRRQVVSNADQYFWSDKDEVAENNSGNVDGNSSADESSKTVGNDKNGRGSLVNSTNLIQVADHGNLHGNFQSHGNPLFQGNNSKHLLVNNNAKMIMERGADFEAGKGQGNLSSCMETDDENLIEMGHQNGPVLVINSDAKRRHMEKGEKELMGPVNIVLRTRIVWLQIRLISVLFQV
ncbi:hypothetical protein LguiB_005911 [Lonicera macranthoides]